MKMLKRDNNITSNIEKLILSLYNNQFTLNFSWP